MPLSDVEVIEILVSGLISIISGQTNEQLDGCDAIGVVIELGSVQKSYIFKYEIDTQDHYLIEIKHGSLEPNSIVYYHDTQEDVIVKAAIHGEGIIDEKDLSM